MSFRVMSYNIRMDTASDGVNRWDRRKDRVVRLIQNHQPDLIGVQEALPNQLADLQAALPYLGWYGVGRDDGKERGEFSAVLYNLDRFERRDQGTFWLSETPNVPGSQGWDAALPRVCSWVKLRDRQTNRELCHFNTHLDHGQIARRESARLILTNIARIAGPTIPTILTGDLNSDPQSDAYRLIVTNTSLRDTYSVTESAHRGPNGTWSTFNTSARIGRRIDYIFLTTAHLRVNQHAHLTYSENNYYPSDHLPVFAELTFQTPKKYFRNTIYGSNQFYRFYPNRVFLPRIIPSRGRRLVDPRNYI